MEVMKTMLFTAVALGAVLAGMMIYNKKNRSGERGDASHRLNYPGSGSGQLKKNLML
jgi:hypothetical protein